VVDTPPKMNKLSPTKKHNSTQSTKPPLLSTIINNIVQKKDDGSMRITGKVHW
jgi:hypothetical protein